LAYLIIIINLNIYKLYFCSIFTLEYNNIILLYYKMSYKLGNGNNTPDFSYNSIGSIMVSTNYSTVAPATAGTTTLFTVSVPPGSYIFTNVMSASFFSTSGVSTVTLNGKLINVTLSSTTLSSANSTGYNSAISSSSACSISDCHGFYTTVTSSITYSVTYSFTGTGAASTVNGSYCLTRVG